MGGRSAAGQRASVSDSHRVVAYMIDDVDIVIDQHPIVGNLQGGIDRCQRESTNMNMSNGLCGEQRQA